MGGAGEERRIRETAAGVRGAAEEATGVGRRGAGRGEGAERAEGGDGVGGTARAEGETMGDGEGGGGRQTREAGWGQTRGH